MPPKGHRTGASAQPRAHSRSSSASKIGANLQFTQRDSSATRAAEKSKKNTHEGARPGFQRTNSSQRVPSNTQVKRTASTNNATQHKTNATKPNTEFTLNQAARDEDDEDDWVSSSGAQTPNKNESDSDTASESDGIPQELVSQLQRAQIEQTARTHPPLVRADAVLQSAFNAAEVPNTNVPRHHITSTQMPFPTTGPDPVIHPDPYSQHIDHHQTHIPDHGMQKHHTRSDSRHSHHYPSSKRQPATRPPSIHSIPTRLDAMRPHPLIRGHSHGYINPVFKPTPLAPLTVIADQPSNSPTEENQLSTSPASVRTTVTSPGGYIAEFPHERRTSFSSARSISTLPAQPVTHRPYDRNRTLSAMSTSASSAALSSLAHLPSITRPSSPQQILFPPVNPHVNIEAIHPLLPGPYLNNHLTVLARRTPLRESYDRVIQAKIANGR